MGASQVYTHPKKLHQTLQEKDELNRTEFYDMYLFIFVS